MDLKKYRRVEIFNSLAEGMRKKGFCKTAEQMQLKLEKLNQDYRKCKDNNNKRGATPKYMPFFKELEILFSIRPTFEVIEGGVATAAVEFVQIPIVNISDEAGKTRDVINTVDVICTYIYVLQMRTIKVAHIRYMGEFNNILVLDLEHKSALFKTVMTELTQNQVKVLKNLMEDQRQWERGMLEQEREFQKQQNESLLTTLQKCLENIHSNAPYKILHITCPISQSDQFTKTDKICTTVTKKVMNIRKTCPLILQMEIAKYKRM
ncbi:Myb/SANT-like DNA-binding domain [Popillia japonica]|uniref:Myb/SANT-like DNA-binding domain n=1 Tax=Popillia japonica TaxID=7064 RepID=A0AAW1LUA6_POPJA